MFVVVLPLVVVDGTAKVVRLTTDDGDYGCDDTGNKASTLHICGCHCDDCDVDDDAADDGD